jgi:hypothetical protein
MRSLLTGGIKAILATAVIATGIHWVLRLQREPEGLVAPVVASLPDVETTGSISPRETPPEAKQAALPPAGARQTPATPVAARAPVEFDQSALASLMATASAAPKAKAPVAAKVPATIPSKVALAATPKAPATAKAALAPKANAAAPAVAKSPATAKTVVAANAPAVAKPADAKPALTKPAAAAKTPERPKAAERTRTAER